MAIDSSTIKKTSNIIQLGGVKFNSPSNKKLRFVDEDFTGVPTIENAPANLRWWLNDGMPTNYEDYGYPADIGSRLYGSGYLSYAKLIDIAPYYNNGARYMYFLGTRYQQNEITDEEMQSWVHNGICLFKKVGNVYSTIEGSGANTKTIKCISNIAKDESVALSGNFKNYLSELIYPLETIVNTDFHYMIVGSANRSRGRVEWDGGYALCDYPNTAIDRPIVRWIYEN